MPQSALALAPFEADDTARQARAVSAEAEAMLAGGRLEEAIRLATEAAKLDPQLAAAWLALARASDAQSGSALALGAYEQALIAGADIGEIGDEAGRLALRLGHLDRAERFLAAALERGHGVAETIIHLAEAQTGLQAFDRAHETLKTALQADPGQSSLWVALGRLLCCEGRHDQSTVFFEEGLRLAPDSAAARAGLAEALLTADEVDRALALSGEAVAMASPEELPGLTAAHARRLLSVGRLIEGWAAFAQGMEPGPAAGLHIRAAAPRWRPEPGLDGPLLLIGEERATDEILAAHVVPQVVAEGRDIILAVSAGFMSLAQRSFPQATVVRLAHETRRGRSLAAAVLDSPHMHGGRLVTAWRPLRANLGALRADPSGFVGVGPYLRPDAARVAHWRDWLAGLGPGAKVGLCWRPPLLDIGRPGEVPRLSDLGIPLATRGLGLVSLQGADVAELNWMREVLGLTIHAPPGLDQDDLDDLAALACALDTVVGPPGLATYLAAASGARTLFLATPGHWALLGADHYPWFPKAEVIFAEDGDWTPAIDALGETLAALAHA